MCLPDYLLDLSRCKDSRELLKSENCTNLVSE